MMMKNPKVRKWILFAFACGMIGICCALIYPHYVRNYCYGKLMLSAAESNEIDVCSGAMIARGGRSLSWVGVLIGVVMAVRAWKENAVAS